MYMHSPPYLPPSQQTSADPTWKQSIELIGLNPELNYLTQIVILLFEDLSQPEGSDTRYKVDLLFSPGVKRCCQYLAGSSGPLKTSFSSSVLLGSSPDRERKLMGPQWVKRFPPVTTNRDDDSRRAWPHHRHSPPSTIRRTSLPSFSLRSASDSCIETHSTTGRGTEVATSPPDGDCDVVFSSSHAAEEHMVKMNGCLPGETERIVANYVDSNNY